MKLSEFGYTFREELIEQYPPEERDKCRLMVLNKKTGAIEHKMFSDILKYFNDKDVMLFNDTKVFPARLYGNKEKTGARIEVFLLRELNSDMHLWDVLVDPARKIRIGNKLYFGEDNSLVAEVIDNTTSRGRTLRFLSDLPSAEFKELLYKLGNTPLPRDIITRDPIEADEASYQTIYAKNEGAVAAPAAGLHFSREIMKRLEIRGVNIGFLTLHVGLGNFRPVEVEDLTKHKMDSEEVHLGEQICNMVNKAKDEKRQICVVGTTCMRAVETAVSTLGHIKPFDGWTNKFIFPPYEVQVPTSMITNFHLPHSTLLMMVCTLGGYKNVMNAYEVAVKEGYKFGPYGDAMLII